MNNSNIPDEITIRTAVPTDAAALLSIYEYYVNHTAITYEYDVPSVEEFTGRIENILRKYPYLVAEASGNIVGYAYASAFHPRAAYQWISELSIYLDKNYQGHGLGRIFYEKMFEILKRQNIRKVVACIAFADPDDEYLTNDSTKFHQHLGFTEFGHFKKCGYKFGRWYDMTWMEKTLIPDANEVLPIKKYL